MSWPDEANCGPSCVPCDPSANDDVERFAQKIIKSNMTAEEHYTVIDLALTYLLEKSGAELEGGAVASLLQLDRYIRAALGLSVIVAHSPHEGAGGGDRV